VLITRDQAALLIVDVQAKLLPAIYDAPGLSARLRWLISVARDNQLPTVFTEHYPIGLGATLPDLSASYPEAPIVPKTHFSCVAAQCLPDSIMERAQIIICGIETHVCVLQTALQLQQRGKAVFVVADATGSRQLADHSLALSRLSQAGVHVVNREMVLFELLEQAGTAHFKHMSERYLKGTQPL